MGEQEEQTHNKLIKLVHHTPREHPVARNSEGQLQLPYGNRRRTHLKKTDKTEEGFGFPGWQPVER